MDDAGAAVHVLSRQAWIPPELMVMPRIDMFQISKV
jgi:hypothetical protein